MRQTTAGYKRLLWGCWKCADMGRPQVQMSREPRWKKEVLLQTCRTLCDNSSSSPAEKKQGSKEKGMKAITHQLPE